MKRTASTLYSIGASAGLIALGVWFLYDHHRWIWAENGGWAMNHNGMMGGGGMGIVMVVFWVVLLVAIVALISGAFNGIRGAKQNQDNQPNSLEILKQRYVRGEIDKIEYEEKRRDVIH